jgi:hypothetical protein
MVPQSGKGFPLSHSAGNPFLLHRATVFLIEGCSLQALVNEGLITVSDGMSREYSGSSCPCPASSNLPFAVPTLYVGLGAATW